MHTHTHTLKHTHSIVMMCTYSGKYVSKFSLSSSDTKLQRLDGNKQTLHN